MDTMTFSIEKLSWMQFPRLIGGFFLSVAKDSLDNITAI